MFLAGKSYLFMALLIVSSTAGDSVAAQPPTKVAMLGTFLENDNEGLDPTRDAERARLTQLGEQFMATLEQAGRYVFVPVTADVANRISRSQALGRCGGCELQFGKELGADAVAWIEVQKVSNLILNMNVYVAGIADPKLNFVHSVDIRGNTDESWSRSLRYLLQNYFLPPATQ